MARACSGPPRLPSNVLHGVHVNLYVTCKIARYWIYAAIFRFRIPVGPGLDRRSILVSLSSHPFTHHTHTPAHHPHSQAAQRKTVDTRGGGGARERDYTVIELNADAMMHIIRKFDNEIVYVANSHPPARGTQKNGVDTWLSCVQRCDGSDAMIGCCRFASRRA